MDSRQEQIDLYLDLMKRALTASIYEESAWEVIGPHRREKSSSSNPLSSARESLKGLVSGLLGKRSLALVRLHPFDEQAREEGRDWPLFGYAMTGHRRLENVQMCLEDVLRNDVPGDLIETGAWRGGTTIFMRALLKAYGVTDRKVWVADSFEGLPVPENEQDGWDMSRVDYFKVSLDRVKSNFERFGLLDDQVEFLEGWFRDTLPDAPVDAIAILRLDGDLYSSTMDALRSLYHKVSRGGYVIVDDYYAWPACRRAVTDFLAEHSIEPEIKEIDWTGVYWQRQ